LANKPARIANITGWDGIGGDSVLSVKSFSLPIKIKIAKGRIINNC